MIDFLPLEIEKKTEYDRYLMSCGNRGCEYSFPNLYLWGRQKAAFLENQLVFFSQFNRKSVYLFPVGPGDRKVALDAIILDSQQRGIPCRLTGLCLRIARLWSDCIPGGFGFITTGTAMIMFMTLTDWQSSGAKNIRKNAIT